MIQSQGRQADWRRANPAKYECHKAVGRLVKSGKLIKQPCQVCGATDEHARIDAHHDDYSKPEAVTWLCRSHHVRLHRSHQISTPNRGAANAKSAQRDSICEKHLTRRRPGRTQGAGHQPSLHANDEAPAMGAADETMATLSSHHVRFHRSAQQEMVLA